MAQKDEFAADDSDGGIWQYTTVPTDFSFPTEIEHEIIDEIYMRRESTVGGQQVKDIPNDGILPDAGTQNLYMKDGETISFTDSQWELVFLKSMEITGNSIGSNANISSPWYPKARVRYLPDYPRMTGILQPLAGVKVRAYHYYNIGSSITGEDGWTGPITKNITGWRFRDWVDYVIVWDDDRWNIRDGRTGQAKTYSPENMYQESWDKIIIGGQDKHGMFASCHKALYNYFYRSNKIEATKGLTLSGINKMNVGVLHDKEGDNLGRFNFAGGWLGGNPIVVWGLDGSTRRADHQIESTIYHELGHASQYTALIRAYPGLIYFEYLKVEESWANAVRYAFMSSLYPNYRGPWHTSGNYTGIGEWLMLNGVTLKQMEDCLINAGVSPFAWESWRDNIKEKSDIVDDEILDIFFADPWTTWRLNFKELIEPSPSETFTDEMTFNANHNILRNFHYHSDSFHLQ